MITSITVLSTKTYCIYLPCVMLLCSCVIPIMYGIIIGCFNSQVEQMSLWTDELRCKLGGAFYDILYSDLHFQ